MIKEGAIGLAFKFFDLIFYVIRFFWVVVEFGVVRTYTRTSNVTTNRTNANKQNKQQMKINFYLIKIDTVV